jgi:hypothetical protein
MLVMWWMYCHYIAVSLLSCSTVLIRMWIPAFRTYILLPTSGPKMEAVCSSETLVSTYKSTRYYNPEDQQRHTHCRENRKSHSCITFSNLLLPCKFEGYICWWSDDNAQYRRDQGCGVESHTVFLSWCQKTHRILSSLFIGSSSVYSEDFLTQWW